MALAVTPNPVAAVFSTANTSDYAFASFTPTANSLLVILAVIDGTAGDVTINSVGTPGIVWTSYVGGYVGGGQPIVAFAQMPAAGLVPTVFTLHSTGVASGCCMALYRITGHRVGTPLAQYVFHYPITAMADATLTRADAWSTNLYLALLGLPRCAPAVQRVTPAGFVSGYLATQRVTPSGFLAAYPPQAPSGWTRDADAGHTLPAREALFAHRLGGETSTTVPLDASAPVYWVAGYAEVADAAAPVSVTLDGANLTVEAGDLGPGAQLASSALAVRQGVFDVGTQRVYVSWAQFTAPEWNGESRALTSDPLTAAAGTLTASVDSRAYLSWARLRVPISTGATVGLRGAALTAAAGTLGKIVVGSGDAARDLTSTALAIVAGDLGTGRYATLTGLESALAAGTLRATDETLIWAGTLTPTVVSALTSAALAAELGPLGQDIDGATVRGLGLPPLASEAGAFLVAADLEVPGFALALEQGAFVFGTGESRDLLADALAIDAGDLLAGYGFTPVAKLDSGVGTFGVDVAVTLTGLETRMDIFNQLATGWTPVPPAGGAWTMVPRGSNTWTPR